MLIGTFFGGKQVLCNSMCEETVNLFRHRAIEAAQTCLHMHHWHTQFDGRQGVGNGRVYVAHHEHEIRLALQQDLLEALQNAAPYARELLGSPDGATSPPS